MDNYNLLPENEYIEFENRRYLNPNLQVTQTNDFINNLRRTQQANNQEIRQQTYNLGTSVPSNLGGLVGGEGYWTSRYQTPQTNAVTQNLRTAAQAAALNQALANEQAMWKKRYQDAYNAYQKRQNDKTNIPTTEGGQETEDTTRTIEGIVPGTNGGFTVPNIDTENNTVLGYTYVPYDEEGKTNYSASLTPSYDRVNPTHFSVPRHQIGYQLPNGQVVWADSSQEYIGVGPDGKYYAVNKQTGQGQYIGG